MSQTESHDIPPEVIRAASAGDPAAHAAIYRAYSRPVYTLIRRLVVRPAVADELFQDVFVQVLRSIGDYSGAGSFGGWVRRIAVRKCLMYLRSPWHRAVLWLDAPERDAEPALPDPGPRVDAQAAAQADLERALAALPALSRTIVWLHDVEGYTHEEIARLFGRTVSFSKSQLARAHARLRELLDPQVESWPCTSLSISS
ncbi:MAG: RNA polymerase subunit sigma-24 [Proteobacteria bacterium]|nr:MAG: RNA polymerase subunit sigma-24 [Pseudomonadota bacterium]